MAAEAPGRYIAGPLEEQKLRQLQKHKYNVSGTSLLEPLMQKVWNWQLQFVPLRAAPNAITLTGLVLNGLSALLLMAHSPDARQEVPAWVCVYSALALLAYQALDALDGKQARRTGSSSPLGELFDHGCDAANTLFVSLSSGVITGLGHQPSLLLAQVLVSMSLFFVAHWMAYITGGLRFGQIDVTEAQLCIASMYLLTGVFGVSGFWTLELFGFQLRLLQFVVFCMTSTPIFLRLCACIKNGGVGKNGSTVANTSIIFPGIVWAVMPLLALMVAGKSPSLYAGQPCLFLFTFGVVGVKLCENMIMAHMSRSELGLWDSCLLAPLALALNQYCNHLLPEHLVLAAAAVYATADVLVYSARVCRQIAAYLGIHVLTIKRASAAE